MLKGALFDTHFGPPGLFRLCGIWIIERSIAGNGNFAAGVTVIIRQFDTENTFLILS